ncbi:MAG: ABC transporter permease [Verrucomicrobia bacterium]|nr:MAG: ABC transporter permease [Verrucomicrobiota bacterium]
MLQAIGRMTLGAVAELGDYAMFTSRALASAVGAPRLLRRMVWAVNEQGVRCLPVVLIVGAFAGLVLGLQGYYVLSRFGSEGLLGTLVSLTLTRELGPVLAALMVVGQAGSAMAAEIGIQRNSEQIDALETMGIDPRRYLVAPRLLVSIVVFPIHAALFTLIGIVGGWLSGSVLLHVDGGVYWTAVMRAVEPGDVRECLIKAVVFGLITTAICCHNGFNAHRRAGLTGAKAVSYSTTRAVVLSSIAILAADYLITSALI